MNQRGVALPMALVVLMVLTSLMVAFSVMATTEPMIAGNHMRASKARSYAESGIERALWALSSGAVNPDAITPVIPALDPYDGNRFMGLNGQGGFTIKMSRGLLTPANEMLVEAIGWTPTNDVNDPQPKGVKKIEMTAMKIRALDPPCALCVEGELQVTGTASVDARGLSSNGGGFCGGWQPAAGTVTSGQTYIGGSGNVYGPDGNSTPNELTDKLENAPPATFDFKWTDEEIAFIKSLAKANGTYYQGAVTFNSGNPLPQDGVVFVDTTTGQPFTSSTPDSEAASVGIHGGSTPAGGWNGWIISAGSIAISGNVVINGLVYAQNDISYTGTGTGKITGALVSENRKDAIASTIDATTGGNADVVFNCQMVRDGGGTISQNWFVKSGTYKETEGYTHN